MATDTNIPGQIVEDLREGKITNKMFNVLFWLYSRANCKTGIVRMVSAKRIIMEQWADDREYARPSERTIQETLWRLAKCGYLGPHQTGVKGSYAVTLSNYPAVKTEEDGSVTELVLNPCETLAVCDEVIAMEMNLRDT